VRQINNHEGLRLLPEYRVSRQHAPPKAFPQLKDPRYPGLPHDPTFLHAEDILDMYPDLRRKQRETKALREYAAAVFGAMPPFGNLYGVPVYVEERLAETKILPLTAGSIMS
jgi:hypothetical protein